MKELTDVLKKKNEKWNVESIFSYERLKTPENVIIIIYWLYEFGSNCGKAVR